MNGRVERVHGALVEVRPLPVALHELVEVGPRRLLGEVIRLRGDRATVQVYEDTTGLAVGDPVRAGGAPLEARLGPGLLGSVLDGIGRSLPAQADAAGDFLRPGMSHQGTGDSGLMRHQGTGDSRLMSHQGTGDSRLRLPFEAARRAGEEVAGGDVLGTATDRGRPHPILVPPRVRGRLAWIAEDAIPPDAPCARLEDGAPLFLHHLWPVRVPRPAARRLPSDRPLVTGQRVLDLLFPVAEGGAVALPGGFGTGKTVLEQALARHAEADVIVYVGCGERGNEMAELLDEFPKLVDPRSGRSLMERTVLVVNTSNMPVAARESSVPLALTIAEYFRDQGLRVAVLADSLSRWAEALREIGSRLQEMPGEEGYPTSLASRLGRLYERSGRVEALGSPRREGSVSFIGAVSPPGGDFTEPVTQAAVRVAGALWALDPRLAQQRQFPAVSVETSWSGYGPFVDARFSELAGADWTELRLRVARLLQRERELREIAEIVGQDSLEDADRLVLEVGRTAREVVVGQSAFDPADAFSPPPKTRRIADLALQLEESARRALAAGTPWEELPLDALRRLLVAVRDAPAGPEAEAAEARAREALAEVAAGPARAVAAPAEEEP